MVIEQKILDTETPISVFLKLKEAGLNPIYLLESVEGGEVWGRYSFLGFGKPYAVFEYSVEGEEGILRVRNKAERIKTKKPLSVVKDVLKNSREEIEQIKAETGAQRIPYGFVGCVGYDFFSTIENVETWQGKSKIPIPDILLVFTKNIVIFDNIKKSVILVCDDEVFEEFFSAISKAKTSSPEISEVFDVKSDIEKDEFIKIVRKAKDYIVAGDIVQVVLARKIVAKTSTDPFSFYRFLRVTNPSPYMYFADFGSTANLPLRIAGTSPEILVRMTDGLVETRPIAGTRKRGKTPEEDKELEDELLSDEKELAEHLMLVDLARNDLGKVCKFGTVKVSRYAYIERYSKVMHIVSDVVGRTEKDFDEVFESCFPAGTVVGAPKIRASEIIAELEVSKRGPYAGAFGYFSADGNMDTAIVIRTAIFWDDEVHIQAGAGIVYDSIPEREWKETEHKMSALYETLTGNLKFK